MNESKFEDLVQSLAPRYAAPGVPVEDLEQEARLAAFLAESSWVPSKEPTERAFRNYVSCKIKDALKEYRRKNFDDAISLDDEIAEDQEGRAMTRHDIIGTPPNQEAPVEVKRRREELKGVSKTSLDVITLRAEGHSFSEIGKTIGKTEEAAKKIWQRAQTHFVKEAA